MCVITAATEAEFNQSGLWAVTRQWKPHWKMTHALCYFCCFFNTSLQSFPVFTLVLAFNVEKSLTKLILRTLASKARDLCWDVTLNQVLSSVQLNILQEGLNGE